VIRSPSARGNRFLAQFRRPAAAEHLPHRGAGDAPLAGGGAGAAAGCISVRMVGQARPPPVVGLVKANRRVPGPADPGLALVFQFELRGQGRVGLGPPVGQQRRVRRIRQGRERGGGPRAPTAAPSGTGRAWTCPRCRRRRTRRKPASSLCTRRDVQAVEPGHGLVAGVVGDRARTSKGSAAGRPARIGTGSPLTTVQTPSPWTTKTERAPARAGAPGATSPTPRYWIAAHSVGVRGTGGRPGPGFARRDRPALTAAPDRHQVPRRARASGSRSDQAQWKGLRRRRRVLRHQVADLGPQRLQVGAGENPRRVAAGRPRELPRSWPVSLFRRCRIRLASRPDRRRLAGGRRLRAPLSSYPRPAQPRSRRTAM